MHEHPTRRGAPLAIWAWKRASLLCGVAATLSACGGAGGGGPAPVPPIVSPAPTPAPAPAPAPAPTPSPTAADFNTAEFRRSSGAPYHGAVTAWVAGATGRGVTIGVIDSGADIDSPEFAGRIHPLSDDVAGGGRGADDAGSSGHGTNVAQVALGARDNVGTLGIAFEATLLALRADRPGSCQSSSDPNEAGCRYTDTAIAAGVDRAVTAGARVINISLGGSSPSLVLRQAVQRATAAGIIIVVSAGNEGDGSDPDVDPNQPNPFAQGLQTSGGDLVIIAGSNTRNGLISPFSNRAGLFAGNYLSALGSSVCCVYENGVLKTEVREDGTFVFNLNGTSFSAPQIAGAVALLAQAFPNLTGQQIVNILLSTATDAGDAGTDAVFGRGILNIASAFTAQGQSSLAGTSVAVPLGAPIGGTSGPMGDAAARGGADVVILDAYERAFTVDLGRGLSSAPVRPMLTGALERQMRSLVAGNGLASMSVSLVPQHGGAADQVQVGALTLSGRDAAGARVLAASVIAQIAPTRRIGFAIERGSSGLVASMTGQPGHAFLVADDADSARLLASRGEYALALRQQVAPYAAVTIAAENGRIGPLRGRSRLYDATGFSLSSGYDSFSVTTDAWYGPARGAVALRYISEDATFLGARFAPGLAGSGSRTLFADAQVRIGLGGRNSIGGQWREGWTFAGPGGLARSGNAVRTRAWAFDVARTGLFASDDRLAIRYAQPLRVSGGALLLDAPVTYDYATRLAGNGLVPLSLTPLGRERVLEAVWSGRMLRGQASLNGYWRAQPGHYRDARDDFGGAIRLSWGY